MLEWHGTVVLTTPRLLLRAFRRDDLPRYAELNADLEVMRYLGGVLGYWPSSAALTAPSLECADCTAS